MREGLTTMENTAWEGKAHIFGDHINTDIITPGKYMERSVQEMARHVMEGVDSDFVAKLTPGDVIVAGNNFGSGSSRETAPLALKEAGVSAVIAKSFARIFFRNALNLGFPVLELKDADKIKEDDRIRIDLRAGKIENLSSGQIFCFEPLPEHLLTMLRVGGLEAMLANENSNSRKGR